VEFVDENGGGPGVRLRKRQQKKGSRREYERPRLRSFEGKEQALPSLGGNPVTLPPGRARPARDNDVDLQADKLSRKDVRPQCANNDDQRSRRRTLADVSSTDWSGV
jgi:hypothetical protein